MATMQERMHTQGRTTVVYRDPKCGIVHSSIACGGPTRRLTLQASFPSPHTWSVAFCVAHFDAAEKEARQKGQLA